MRKNWIGALGCAAALSLSAVNCGDNSSENCANLGGTWKIASHCQSEFVNQAVQVTQQQGCGISMTEPFEGFSGVIDADGKITVVGTAGSTALNCTGSATANMITMNCNSGECAVTLQK